jgi:translocation and assembly module TamB
VSRTRARRLARVAAGSLAGLVGIVLVVVALGAWLLGRETTLQRIVVEAEKALGGQLRVEGVTGSIYDRVAFERLVFRSKTQVVTLEHGSLRYALEPFERRFTIADARAAKLVIETIGHSDEPGSEPDTLALPASLRIDTLRLDAVHLDAIDLVADGRTTTLTAADLRGRYGSEGGTVGEEKRWVVERIAVTTPWGQVAGNATLAATRPFGIDGRLVAEGKAFDVPYRAPLAISGRLADLVLASDFTVSDPAHQQVTGHADARVLPFRDQPIDRAVLHLAGVSPKRWKADLPEADLAIDATITPSTTPVDDGGTNPFTGTIRVVNAAPGPIDRDRVPVVSLNADVAGDSLAIVASRLVADLGVAGRLSGQGSYRFANGGTPSFSGDVRALDLRAIHGKLIASRFAGPIAVSRKDGVLRLDTVLADTGRSVKLRGEFEGSEIRVAEAAITLGGSRVSAAGQFDLARDRPFALHGEVAHLDPHDFGDFAKADVNATFAIDGTIGAAATSRSPQTLRVRSDLRIAPSRVLDRPIAGTVAGIVVASLPTAVARGQPAVRLEQVVDAKVALKLGTNRIDLDGNFGRPQDRLRWNVDAPRLADLGARLSGAMRGQGAVGGTLAEPAVDFTIAADELRYARPVAAKGATTATTLFSLKSLRGQGRLLAGASGALDADIALTELRDNSGAKSPTLDTAEAHVKGTRDAHTLTLLAKSDRFDVTGAAHGGLDARNVWRGIVDSLQSRGRAPFSTEGETSLVAGVERVEVGAAHLKFAEGRVDLERLLVEDGRIDTAGKASGFPLAIIGTFSRDFNQQVSTSLKFGGEWNLKIGDSIDGRVRLFRESGNIRFLTEPRFEVDPEKIEIAADIVADRVSALVSADGKGLGRIGGSVETRLSKRDGQWGLAGDAPLTLKSDVDIPDLRWLARLSGVPGLDVYGALTVAVTGHGTVAEPLLAGHASGTAIGLRWPDQGINARDGKVDLDFDGDRVVIRQATLASGDGHLDASGELRLADRKAAGTLNVKFDKFETVSRTDRTIVVSGSGSLRFGATGIDVTADVKADRGSLQLAERSGPTLSNDIVIVGREQVDAESAIKPTPVRFEVKFDMGDDFKVKGAGFDGKLGGVIRIAGSGADLRAIGSVNVREGTYEGYGQRLTIVRGVLTFSGPIDNPALDINAVRKNLAVEAGVQISGTALAPQARLVSTPDVPDTEKLSWLVLGHGLAASNKSDYGILTSAAAGLLGSSDSAGIQSRIAATLGVDEIGVSGLGGDKGGLLTVGKQISSRLRVSFEQGFTRAATLIKVRYNVYQRVDLQVQTGTESAVDIFYTFSFD